MEKKGVNLSTGQVRNVKEADVKEFLKQKNATSQFIVEIENGEDVATVVAYV